MIMHYYSFFLIFKMKFVSMFDVALKMVIFVTFVMQKPLQKLE